jgi:hypothetical protein
VNLGHGRLDELDPRHVGKVTAALVTVADTNPEAACGLGGDFFGEAALADTRFPAYEDEPTLPGSGAVQSTA